MNQSNTLIEQDVEAYLAQHEQKRLLRFLTCGNVDDGKSTLIGRLLHDTQMIYDDQLASLKKDSKKFNTTDQEIDLALLVDGLQSEREQGITIDVAYRYFSTSKRKFIIADCPGHEQYTRNMATGASTCDLAIILIDARYGVQTQTRRHSFIVSLLGIRQVIVAVNKMDLMDFSEQTFNQIRDDYLAFAAHLNIPNIQFVPMSALRGDNVVSRSEAMGWYHGEPLLTLLEDADTTTLNHQDFRFPVQYVNRPNLDFRGFAGTLASGVVRVGDDVTVLPSGKRSTIARIVTFDGDLDEAFAPQSVTLTLSDEVDVSRGDMLVHSNNQPQVGENVEATIVWMAEEPMLPNKQYDFKIATRATPGSISAIDYRIDVNNLSQHQAVRLELNEIARCQVRFNQVVAFDPYSVNRGTGAFVIIDRLTNVTVGAGMIIGSGRTSGSAEVARFSEFELDLNALIRKHFPHWEAKDLRELLK
ncbi:MAG: sulfate adenylyltransferase subunit CysN [Gammaproteobacteria bacterium]|nr:sulfate adenylyltransferase subunit CysN [Gammaproteobacteria bacterium]